MATMYWSQDHSNPDRYHLTFRQRAKRVSGFGTVWFRPEINFDKPYRATVYLTQFEKKLGVYATRTKDNGFFESWRDAEKWAAGRYNEMLKTHLGVRNG